MYNTLKVVFKGLLCSNIQHLELTGTYPVIMTRKCEILCLFPLLKDNYLGDIRASQMSVIELVLGPYVSLFAQTKLRM